MPQVLMPTCTALCHYCKPTPTPQWGVASPLPAAQARLTMKSPCVMFCKHQLYCAGGLQPPCSGPA